MEWEKAEQLDDSTFQIPKCWMFLHYYQAYNVLFRIENALRVFVYLVLKQEYGEQWDLRPVSFGSSTAPNPTIRVLAKERLKISKQYGHLGDAIGSLLQTLTMHELLALILSEKDWQLFTGCFPLSRNLLESKIKEIMAVRNNLAHFRAVTPSDVDDISQIASRVLSGVGDFLQSAITQPRVVPSNCEEEWYRAFQGVSCGL